MEKKNSLAESVIERVEFKRKFSLLELYQSFVYAPRAMRKIVKNKKTKLVALSALIGLPNERFDKTTTE